MSDSINKPTTWYWVIVILALLWNLMGLAAFLGIGMVNEAALIERNGSQYTAIFLQKPFWAISSNAIAVIAGTLGCIGLLFRKSWASWLFIISLVAIIIHLIWLFTSGLFNLAGTNEKILVAAVVLIGIFLIWFTNNAEKKGWLN